MAMPWRGGGPGADSDDDGGGGGGGDGGDDTDTSTQRMPGPGEVEPDDGDDGGGGGQMPGPGEVEPDPSPDDDGDTGDDPGRMPGPGEVEPDDGTDGGADDDPTRMPGPGEVEPDRDPTRPEQDFSFTDPDRQFSEDPGRMPGPGEADPVTGRRRQMPGPGEVDPDSPPGRMPGPGEVGLGRGSAPPDDIVASDIDQPGQVPSEFQNPGEITSRAQGLEEEVLQQNPQLGEGDVMVDLVRQGDEFQFRTRLSDTGQRAIGAAAISEQLNESVSREDVTVDDSSIGVTDEFTQEQRREQAAEQLSDRTGENITPSDVVLTDEGARLSGDVLSDIAGEDFLTEQGRRNFYAQAGSFPVDEPTGREARQFTDLERGEDFTIEQTGDGVTVSFTEDYQEEQIAQQLGRAPSTVDRGEDYIVTDEGDVRLTPQGRQAAIEAQVAEQGFVREPENAATIPVLGGEIGPEAERREIQSITQLQFDEQGQLTGVDPIDREGVAGAVQDTTTWLGQNVVQPGTDITGDVAEFALRSNVPAGFPILTPSGPTQVGAAEEASMRDILRAPSDEVTRTTFAERLGEGGGMIATAPAALPGMAETAVSTASGVGEFAAEEVEREGAVGAIDEIAAAGAEESVDFAERTTASVIQNPARTGGALVASAGLMGGAAAVSGRAGTATRFAIQPGEEILGYGGAGALRRLPGSRTTRAGEVLFPNNEPLIFSEEAAIRAGRRVGGGLQNVGGRVSRGVRSGIETARRRTPISVEIDPEAGVFEVGDDVPARARQAMQTDPANLARRAGAGGAASVDRLIGRTSRFGGTPEARLQREFLTGEGDVLDTGVGERVRGMFPSRDRLPDAELDEDIATAADEPAIREQRTPDPEDIDTGEGDVLDELTGEGEGDLTDEPVIRSQRVPDPEDIDVPRGVGTEAEAEDPTLRMGEFDPLGIETGRPSPRFKLRETGDAAGDGPGVLGRTRQELTAARFAASERLSGVRSAVGDVSDITIRVGDPDRPSILSEGGETEIPPPDEPAIRSQIDDPFDLDDASETPLEGGAEPGAGGGGGGGGQMLMEGETGVARQTVFEEPAAETETGDVGTTPFEVESRRTGFRTDLLDDRMTGASVDIGAAERPSVETRTDVDSRVDTLLGTEVRTETGTEVFTEMEQEQETGIEPETRQDVRLDVESRQELELRVEQRARTEQELESELFGEREEDDRRDGFGLFASDETFGSGIASAEDILGNGGNGNGDNLL